MLGAIIGDIAGSKYEFNNHKSKDFVLLDDDCFFTDDTIMTLSIANALLECNGDYTNLGEICIKNMQKIGRNYPNSGYGCNFYHWIYSDNPKPYKSYGNGSAMRVSAVAWVAKSLDEVKELSRKVTEISHNAYEGLKGAEATSVAIFLARQGRSIDEIRNYINKNYYKLDFTIDEIRPTYKFNETCQQTVPQAIEAFLESSSFEDSIRIAVSVGGDSDTLAAITGSIAEAYYGIPQSIYKKGVSYLDSNLQIIIINFERYLKKLKFSKSKI